MIQIIDLHLKILKFPCIFTPVQQCWYNSTTSGLVLVPELHNRKHNNHHCCLWQVEAPSADLYEELQESKKVKGGKKKKRQLEALSRKIK